MSNVTAGYIKVELLECNVTHGCVADTTRHCPVIPVPGRYIKVLKTSQEDSDPGTCDLLKLKRNLNMEGSL